MDLPHYDDPDTELVRELSRGLSGFSLEVACLPFHRLTYRLVWIIVHGDDQAHIDIHLAPSVETPSLSLLLTIGVAEAQCELTVWFLALKPIAQSIRKGRALRLAKRGNVTPNHNLKLDHSGVDLLGRLPSAQWRQR